MTGSGCIEHGTVLCGGSDYSKRALVTIIIFNGIVFDIESTTGSIEIPDDIIDTSNTLFSNTNSNNLHNATVSLT